MFDNNVQYEITLTNNSGVDYREWQTGSIVAIGQTLVFTVTGENLANTIMSNVAQHNALRGRTEIVANAVVLGGSSGGGTVSYPSFTGNANKVLTVTPTEDGVEWTRATTQVYVDTQGSLLQDQINLKADAIAVNQVLSTKADLVGGVIHSSQLPSYVDDVLSFPNLISFPSLGEDGKIYIAEDVNKTYRWGGSSYVEIGGGGVALGETSSTAYRGDNGKIAYDHSLSQGNPHNTTTSDINEGTKLFFTESRVNQTVLTGLNTSTATPALATDQLLAAIGKLQAQINNMGSGGGGSSGGITWVKSTNLGTVHPNIPDANNFIEFAKINGMLWIRGFFKNTGPITYESQPVFLRITDNSYKILQRISSISIMLRITALSSVNKSTIIGFYAGKCIDASTVSTSNQYFGILNSSLLTASDFYYIPPTCLGELVIK